MTTLDPLQLSCTPSTSHFYASSTEAGAPDPIAVSVSPVWMDGCLDDHASRALGAVRLSVEFRSRTACFARGDSGLVAQYFQEKKKTSSQKEQQCI